MKILDLCTGSGAIGISIAKYVDNSKITLSDISNEALKVAKQNYINIVGKNSYIHSQNSLKYNVGVDANIDPKKQIKFVQSDLFKNMDKNTKFDIIVSNPPYIKSDVIRTLDKEVQKEPILALDGGKDGLDIYRKIIKEAYKYLKCNGYLCLEIGYDQKKEVINLIESIGEYKDIYSKKDLAGNDRIVICKKKEN